MSVPDSISNVDLVYLDREPDWREPVLTITKWRTLVASSYSGAEQRARLLYQPKYEHAFKVPGQEATEFWTTRSTLENEVGHPVVVPLWTHQHQVTVVATRTYTTSPAPPKRPFKLNRFVYIVESGKLSLFVQIIAITATTVEVAASGWNNDLGATATPAYTTAMKLYPCIRGIRLENAWDLNLNRVSNTDEMIHVEEL